MADVRPIDANALAQRFSAMQECANMRDHVYLMGVLSVIDNAPAIDAVPVVHGVWRIVNVPKKWGGATLRCSECNTGTTYKWNYCPQCGTKMDGGAEG